MMTKVEKCIGKIHLCRKKSGKKVQMMNIGNVMTAFINTKKALVRAIVVTKHRQQISQKRCQTMNELEFIKMLFDLEFPEELIKRLAKVNKEYLERKNV